MGAITASWAASAAPTRTRTSHSPASRKASRSAQPARGAVSVEPGAFLVVAAQHVQPRAQCGDLGVDLIRWLGHHEPAERPGHQRGQGRLEQRGGSQPGPGRKPGVTAGGSLAARPGSAHRPARPRSGRRQCPQAPDVPGTAPRSAPRGRRLVPAGLARRGRPRETAARAGLRGLLTPCCPAQCWPAQRWPAPRWPARRWPAPCQPAPCSPGPVLAEPVLTAPVLTAPVLTRARPALRARGLAFIIADWTVQYRRRWGQRPGVRDQFQRRAAAPGEPAGDERPFPGRGVQRGRQDRGVVPFGGAAVPDIGNRDHPVPGRAARKADTGSAGHLPMHISHAVALLPVAGLDTGYRSAVR